ncbi:MAG: VCBS repeat-containing protein [Actinobacteria bacterium]|nr:VCBS repeat-containing protein [Actinomycetota bacterium]
MSGGIKASTIALISVSVLFLPFFLWPASAADSGADIFFPYQTFPVGSWPEAVAIGDLNSDGRNDVAMTTSFYFDPPNDFQLFVFTQDGKGHLGAPVKYQTDASGANRPQGLAVGDVNGDGRNDIVIGNSGKEVEVFPQNADGSFGPSIKYPTQNSNKVCIADLNHDGRNDIAAIGWGTNSLDVILQNADGTLAAARTYSVTHGGYDDLAVGDLNNDGLTDIAVMSGQKLLPNIGVLLQKPDGSFDSPDYYSVPGDILVNLTHSIAIGDVTGDGLNDVVASSGGNAPNSHIAVFPQNGSGKLGAPVTYLTLDVPETVAIADFNGDGRADVATAHGGWDALSVHLQQPGGTLLWSGSYPLPYASHYNPQGMDAGDLDGDGNPDIAIADYNHGLVVLYNRCGIKPELNLSTSRTYWASFADYSAGLLSVDYSLADSSSQAAYNVNIVSLTATNGVSVSTPLPAAIGTISPGVPASVTIRFEIPAGVASFRSALYATAEDPCGNTFEYPGPMPGA